MNNDETPTPIKNEGVIKKCIKNYTNFKGRATRREYWLWQLFCLFLTFIALIIDGIVGAPVFSLLTFLFLFCPTISVAVRRAHDLGYSEWLILVNFIPIFGWLFFYAFACIDSKKGPNKYGTSEKYPEG